MKQLLSVWGVITTITTLLLAVAPAWAAPPTYSLTSLGLVSTRQICEGWQTPAGVGINDAGRVTGIYCLQNGTPQGELRGFLWTPQHGMVDLGLPSGVTDPTTLVLPSGINARGQIAGIVFNYPPSPRIEDAFVWDRGSFNLIAPNVDAVAINDPGQVTGTLISNAHAFLFSHGTVRDLGVPPGAVQTNPNTINNLRHIAGSAGFPVPSPFYFSAVPVLWTGASWRVLGLPPTGDNNASAVSINNFDEIVGSSYNITNPGTSPSVYHAFLWSGGTYTVLPCVPGEYCGASSINDAGMIGGGTIFSDVGVVWFGGQPYDINTLVNPHDPLHGQMRLTGATLNARGEILSNGIYTSGPNNGRFEVFVLSPSDTVAQQ